jgi:hypothetical protein
MSRIKLTNLTAVRELNRAEATAATGGYYSLFAGAILVALVYRYRHRIWNGIKSKWNPAPAPPRSSNCVPWYTPCLGTTGR